MLQIPPEQSFDKLHEVSDWHTEKNGNRISVFQKVWNADRDRTGRTLSVIRSEDNFEAGRQRYTEFEEVYRAFIAEVVAPGLGGGTIQYQRAPTLRVMVPSEYNTRPDVATTPLHNDMDYHHQPSEINYWLPLSRVHESNSLWVESKPGLGDMHPLDLDYGRYCRFYGNQCRHQTKPNRTGLTRVSLDFRAVSAASGGHNPAFRKGKRRGAKARFQVRVKRRGLGAACRDASAHNPETYGDVSQVSSVKTYQLTHQRRIETYRSVSSSAFCELLYVEHY